ncbi:hypothetical protein CK203_072859 [Vitis vinifera]|uniref:Reverse transcriptase zinc-binding domain-containing protein n=1 Tax=Vitis vinifera TaxID=29760 RepID=A0A438DM63_VITVI|nr:hypothetical protein CK203_072859 [Vitis vinifera]
MRRRLALWKRQYLSKGGRITLIKSTLASIPSIKCPSLECLRRLVEEGDRGEAWVGGCGWKSKEGGRGTKIMFWTDHWCGNVALSQAFPQIFALAVCSNESVNEVWDPRLGQGGWNLRLARDSNDWELVLIEDLLFLLRDIRVTLEEDSMLWKGGDCDSFRIRVAYNLLAALTLSSFREKYLGGQVVKALWEIAFALFGIQWMFPEKVKEALFCWQGPFVAVKNSFVCSLWSWAKLYKGEESSSLLGFLEWVAVP